MKIAFVEEACIDPKKASQVYVMQNGLSPLHFHKTMKEAAGPDVAHCVLHKRACPTPKPDADVWVCGFPCAPWSAQRSDRHSTPWLLGKKKQKRPSCGREFLPHPGNKGPCFISHHQWKKNIARLRSSPVYSSGSVNYGFLYVS